MSSSEATNLYNDKDITDPRDSDVLCGRGGAALRHPGNQTYRRLVNLNKGLYITCLKTEKLKISRSIVAAIREQNGRFLEKDAANGTWFDIGDKKAIEKTSQALREGQPKLRQKIVEMGGGAQGTAALMEQQFGANGIYAQNAAVAAAGQAPHSLQSQNMRGYDPSMQMGAPGGQMGGGMAMMPQQTMASALAAAQAQRHPGAPNQHQHQSGSYQQQQQQQHHQQRMQLNIHHDMPPPQARQALHTEMMRLSMHGNDDDQLPPSRSSMGEPMPLRPSAVKRGSAALQQESNMNFMSDFTGGLGNSNHVAGSMYGMDRKMGSSHHNMDPYGSSAFGGSNPYNQDLDRRRIFAKMKYSRQPSDRLSSRQLGGASSHSIGDGMPDFHMVESSLSLYSNLSGFGSESRRGSVGTSDKKPPGDLMGGAGSRHSIMSGLSRISDTSEVHSIFSDLSKKINTSTRSIAMSEISGIDEYRGGDDSDSTPSFGEAEPRTTNQTGTMDFDVL